MAGGATLNDDMLLRTTLPKWSVKSIEIEWALEEEEMAELNEDEEIVERKKENQLRTAEKPKFKTINGVNKCPSGTHVSEHHCAAAGKLLGANLKNGKLATPQSAEQSPCGCYISQGTVWYKSGSTQCGKSGSWSNVCKNIGTV